MMQKAQERKSLRKFRRQLKKEKYLLYKVRHQSNKPNIVLYAMFMQW